MYLPERYRVCIYLKCIEYAFTRSIYSKTSRVVLIVNLADVKLSNLKT